VKEETSEEGVTCIGEGGGDEFGDGTCDVDDEILMVAFSPVVFAAVSELGGAGEVFIKCPFGEDVGVIPDLLLRIPRDARFDGETGIEEREI